MVEQLADPVGIDAEISEVHPVGACHGAAEAWRLEERTYDHAPTPHTSGDAPVLESSPAPRCRARRVTEPLWCHFALRTAAVILVVLEEPEGVLELPPPRHLVHETSAEQLPSSTAFAPHVGVPTLTRHGVSVE